LGKEYGFPDGSGLREQIANQLPEHERELRDILLWSTAQTVDEIAAQFPNHADNIRRIVIEILHSCENEYALYQNERPNTYKQMLWQIAQAKIDGDRVIALNFNYDRSIPYLIHRTNAVAPEERRIDPAIVHTIYGRLAPLWFEDSNHSRAVKYHEYGAFDSEPMLRVIGLDDDYEDECLRERQDNLDALIRASSVRFIGEKGADTVSVESILEESDQIFFLGCGYHEPNMNILGFDFTQHHSDKLIAGTGYGLSKEFINSLLDKYPAVSAIEPCDAYTFMTSKLKITDPVGNMNRLKRSK
jgi:hypothetical protein